MSSDKHIVYLTPGYPGDESETHCVPVVQNFVLQMKSEHPEDKISIITFQYPYSSEEYKWKGLTVYPMNGRNKKGLSRLTTWKKVRRKFKSIFNPEEETVIHSFWLTECALIGQKISQKYKLNHIGMLMGQDCYGSNKYLRLINHNRFRVACGTDFTASQYLKSTGHEVEKVIPRGLDQVEPASGNELRDIDIIGVGSLSRVKNYLRFVKIIQKILPDHENLKCYLVGEEGEQHCDLVQYIEQHQLTDTIILTGLIPRVEALKLMKRSKILLHTSDTEEQANVFLEAMACGNYVVSTDVSHLPYPDKSLFSNSDEELMAQLNLWLNQQLDHRGTVPYTMKDTVNSYYQLYSTPKNL